MHSFFYATTVLASTLTFATAHGFDASSNTNVAVYWGQGSNQKPLRHFCDEESIDIIPIGFVNVFPDQHGANGYPGTNFGNACGGSYYKSPDGKETRLLESCATIGDDIKYCQAQGKKILLSLGGASPDVYIASESSAKGMADFLWGAFGPAKVNWEGPRPFGDACVDGFDFDIESEAANITGPVDFGYATMVDHFRQLFDGEHETYYISAAPQCTIPDSHLSDAISKSIFDFIFVQFYNSPSCSARAGLDHSYGAYGGPETDISYDSWVDHVKTKSANKEAKIYMGLAAATGATYGSMYLSPDEALQMIEKYQCKWPTMFGGVMLWEATFSENNQINGMSYGKHIKKGLTNCSCASSPPSTSSVVTSSTMSSTIVPAGSTSSRSSISAEYPTSSSGSYSTSSSVDYPASSSAEYPTITSSSRVTSSPSSPESSSSTSYTTTYDDMNMSSTTSASASASPSSCGVKGFDKLPAFNFLNDTATANFEKCSARCNANSACVSFAFGTTQCLLYTQTVASNVNENSNSPFTFYDKNCGTPATSSSSISSSTSSSTSSVVSSSQTSSKIMTSSTYGSQSTVSATKSSSGNETHPTGSYSSTSSSMMASSSGSEPHPTGSISSSSSSKASASVTPSPTYTSSKIPDEGPETVISYIDVTITSCPPDVTACPTKSNGGSSPAPSSSSSPVYPISSSSSSSSLVPGPVGSSSSPSGPSYAVTSKMPTQSSAAPELYTTVITTNYVGICPTGYTTIPYTTTVVTVSGSDSTPTPTSGVPAGFTTTVVVCPACNSASPTVTLTIPVVSVVPVPVTAGSPSAGYPSPSGPSSAGSPSSGSPPAGYSSASSRSAGPPSPSGPSSAGSPAGGSSPAGYTSSAPAPRTSSAVPAGYTASAPAPPKSSAAPVTDMSPKPSVSSPGHSSALPTIATRPYNAGNGTSTFKSAPASAGISKTTGASTGLSGAEATRPAAFTGGASTASEGTFVAVVIAAIWAGLLVV